MMDITGAVYAAVQIQVQYLSVLRIALLGNIYLELAQSLQLKFAQIVPSISLVITWACLVVAVQIWTLCGHCVLRRTIALETAQRHYALIQNYHLQELHRI
jgi:hypothetical protein